MPTDNPAGVLFDVDGTLVDTTYLHTVSWWEALRQAEHRVPMATDPPVDRDGLGQAARPPARPGTRPGRRRQAARRARQPATPSTGNGCDPLPRRRRPAAGLRRARAAGGAGHLGRRARGGRAAPGLDADDVDRHRHLLGGRARRASRRRTSWRRRWSSPGCTPDRVVFVGDSVWDVAAAGKLDDPLRRADLRRHQPGRAGRRGRGGGLRRPGRAAGRASATHRRRLR